MVGYDRANETGHVSAIAGIAEYSAAVANRFSIIARHRAPQVASHRQGEKKNIADVSSSILREIYLVARSLERLIISRSS